MPYNCSLFFFSCREILQSSDPGASFRKARHAEVWAVEKESSGTKTAVVLTGPELVNIGTSVIKVIILTVIIRYRVVSSKEQIGEMCIVLIQ